MYRTVLLTDKESLILLKMIDQMMVNNTDLYRKEETNIHIIKRHLLGTIPTNSVNKSIMNGKLPTNQ